MQIGVTGMSGIVDSWTERRIRAASTWIVERLAADFKDTSLPNLELRIDPTWDGSTDIPPGPRPEDVIVVSGGHEFPLRLDSGVEWACSQAAYQLQDDVIGEHGAPWPELYDGDGRYVGILAPPGDTEGLAQWQLNDQPFCAVGHLHRACEAAGLSIKTPE